MHCPFCGNLETKVNDSRLAAEGNQVRRRRECLACAERFTTFETAELVMPYLVVNHITHQLRTAGERELPSRRVGELVMNELRKLDDVAYVRFASVYRRFQDAAEFAEEVERLQESSTTADEQLPLLPSRK